MFVCGYVPSFCPGLFPAETPCVSSTFAIPIVSVARAPALILLSLPLSLSRSLSFEGPLRLLYFILSHRSFARSVYSARATKSERN